MGTKRVNLPRVKNFAPTEIQEFAQRIDAGFAQTERFLRQFETIEDAQKALDDSAEALRRTRDIFYQTFEVDLSTSWDTYEGTDFSAVTYPANGKAGGKVLRADGEEVFFAFPENIPFEPDRVYRVRCRVQMTRAPTDPGDAGVTVGLLGVAADGTTLVNAAGNDSHLNQHHAAADDYDLSAAGTNTWVLLTGYVEGTDGWGGRSVDPTAPASLHGDVRYVRPFLRLNQPAGDGAMEIDFLAVEVLTRAEEIDLGKAPGEVDETQIGDGAITLAKFAAGLDPVQVVDSLPDPTTWTGPNTVFLTTDKKMYRFDGSVPEWTAAIPSTDITGQITETQISDGAISTPKIAAGSVVTGKLAAGAVTADEIAADAITTGKIVAGAVTADEIAAGEVTADKIGVSQLSAITANVGTLTAGTIQDSAGQVSFDLDTALLTVTDEQTTPVTRIKLGKLGANADAYGIEIYDGNGNLILSAAGLGNDVVDTAQIVADAIGSDEITADAITATQIAAGAVTTNKLEANAVTANEIAADTITANQIAAGAIEANEIAADAIVASKIAADAIQATHIAADQVTAAAIAAGTITANEIDTNTITADRMSVAQLSAIVANLGVITAGWMGDALPGSATAAIRLTGTTQLPSTNYLDFTASGNDPFLKHPALTLEADGDATFAGDLSAAGGTFSGTVSGDLFSASLAKFAERILAGNSGNQQIIIEPGQNAGDAYITTSYGLSGDTVWEIMWDSSEDTSYLRYPFPHNGLHLDDGSTNTARVAGVVVSSSAPSGDYPEGTIWIQT